MKKTSHHLKMFTNKKDATPRSKASNVERSGIMNEYMSPKAELIEFDREMVITASDGCTCQDITSDEQIYVCGSGSLDNSYDTSEAG